MGQEKIGQTKKGEERGVVIEMNSVEIRVVIWQQAPLPLEGAVVPPGPFTTLINHSQCRKINYGTPLGSKTRDTLKQIMQKNKVSG